MTDQTPAGGAPSSNRTIMIVLSYLGILALIPFLVEKNDREVQWHAKHGLILLAVEVVVYIVLRIIVGISLHIPLIGCIGASLGCVAWFVLFLAILAVHITCIVKGINGERFRLPFISQYAD